MSSIVYHRPIRIIASEIAELRQVAGCYNYFLASYESSQMPEARLQVQLNKSIIWKTINALEVEKHEAEMYAREIGKEVERRMKFENYQYSPLEDAAIKAFNSDRRYSITE